MLVSRPILVEQPNDLPNKRIASDRTDRLTDPDCPTDLPADRPCHRPIAKIIFTSGATESNNMSIKGVARFYKGRKKHIITTQTEHKCVLDSCRAMEQEGYEVSGGWPMRCRRRYLRSWC